MLLHIHQVAKCHHLCRYMLYYASNSQLYGNICHNVLFCLIDSLIILILGKHLTSHSSSNDIILIDMSTNPQQQLIKQLIKQLPDFLFDFLNILKKMHSNAPKTSKNVVKCLKNDLKVKKFVVSEN